MDHSSRASARGWVLLAVLMVSACQTAGPGASPSPAPSPTPCPTLSSETLSPTDPPLPTGCPAQVAGAGGAGGGGGVTAPGSGSSVTQKFSETVVESGAGTSSTITQTYQATARISLTKVDVGAWTIAGSADISGTFTSDWQSHMDTELGPCDQHFTDDASGGGTVDVEGGLEALDGFYNFYVTIPGLDTGSNRTMRDDTGCFGGNNREVTPWSLGPVTIGGSGNYSGNTISGSTTEPRTGGELTNTWSFTVDP